MREAAPLPDPRTPEGVRDISEGAEPAEGEPPRLLAFSIHSRRVSSSIVLSVLSDHTTVKGFSVEGRTDESDGRRREDLANGETNRLETTPVHESSELAGFTATRSPMYDENLGCSDQVRGHKPRWMVFSQAP